jgi:Domain of unknown function(DUF2779)
MRASITKSDWLAARQCLTLGWRSLRSDSAIPGEAELFRREQGEEVKRLARELYPNGILVSGQNDKTPVEVTQRLVAGTPTETFFDAAFCAGSFVATADILRRQDGAWHLLEVKSSFSNTGSMNNHVDDLAYTAMVLRQAGLLIVRAALVLLSRDYRHGDGTARLFEIVDKTDEVNDRVTEFNDVSGSVCYALFDEALPVPTLVSTCRTCTFFDDQCLGSGLAHTVLEIPGLHPAKLTRLSVDGIVDLTCVPPHLKLSERQERAKYSALTGNTVVETGLAATLQTIEWPCYYLDFETVATVLPLYAGHGCHRQVLTQFSIHHRDSLDAEPHHSEYLAEAAKDCERELTEALIKKLGRCGSIIVYSNFEATRIKALRAAFPDMAERLQGILDRLKNILPIIEDHVYHPAFRGSFSIKKVLPALVPDLSYAGLDVANGDTAVTRFARMARGEISDTEITITRQNLLDYCKLDTLAMVKVHDALCRLVAVRRAGTV